MLLIEPGRGQGRYTAYLREILRAEGYAGAEVAPLDDGELPGALGRHALALLPRCALSSVERGSLLAWVEGGGALIAFQPDAHLAHAVGCESLHSALQGGCLRVDAERPVMAGLCAEPVLVPVPIVGWSTDAGAVLAWAGTSDGDDRCIPAVVLAPRGRGHVALFAFDLPHAVAVLRQGQPGLADLCSHGLDGVFRPSELFAGWLDAERIHLPQADVLTAMLARLIDSLAPGPRLWYYAEAQQRSTVIMTSDDDWSTVAQFEELLSAIEQRRGTATLFVVPHSNVSPEQARNWSRRGHAFSVHPALESDLISYRDTAEPQAVFVRDMLAENVTRHARDYGGTVATVRNHCVRWLGYVEAARVLAELGVGMDLNFVSVHPFSAGYLAGSGRPLKFVDERGEVLDIYQQPTVWTEETLIHPEMVFSLKWPVERAVAFTTGLLSRAVAESYTPYAINSHPVSFATYSRPLVEAFLDHAVALGVPIVSADHWLAFTRARDAVSISRASRTNDGIEFEADVPEAMQRLCFIVPAAAGELAAGAQVRGAASARVSTEQLWGRRYHAVTLHDVEAGRVSVSSPCR